MAITFNGTSDYITWGDIDALDGVTKLTVSFWVFPDGADTLDYSAFITKYSDAGDQGWGIVQHGGRSIADLLVFARNNDVSTAATQNGPLSVNSWHHVHVVYDGTAVVSTNRLRIWIDAPQPEQVLEFSGVTPTSTAAVTNPLTFGRNVTQYAKCQMAEVGIWPNVAITDQQTINMLGNGFSPLTFGSLGLRFYANLVRPIQDQFGATPTTTGTSVSPHVRTVGVCGPQTMIASRPRGLGIFGGN